MLGPVNTTTASEGHIAAMGGPTAVARMLGIKAPSVIGWGGRIPPDRCPLLEKATGGKFVCERMRPDVRWTRVADKSWPHPKGRPCIDVARGVDHPAPDKVGA